ncbi:hypothetical protein HH303_05245 [Rhodospirillaceae bacterium KN72]|uniref:Uncharacterized protein n=1 Tax=Pacificispira spongiicola TaxID=2729598 RepID=A0A7Y0DYE2_9PROT|nr:hypothetical protein [Pacificispira spongiicola]NMM43871.1 hypothetical protein [Pacificispira spongiicola]
MAELKKEVLSSTVNKVLDEYLSALHADEEIDDESANRLDELLRKGKAPKFEEIDSVLFPPSQGNKT